MENKTRLYDQLAETVVEGLKYTNLSEDSLHMIHSWLLDKDKKKEKDLFLEELFNETFDFKRNPGKVAHQMLPKILRQLGIEHHIVVKPRKKYRLWLWRVAAVLLPAAVILGGIFIFTGRNAGPDLMAHIVVTTPADSVKTVVLADGSEIILYENSRFTYPEDYPEDRSVSLDGKARFHVSKKDGTPFTVSGGEISVTVLGTEFFMTAAQDNPVTEVSLLTGLLSISGHGSDEITIMPGQQFTYDTTDKNFNVHEFTEGHILQLQHKGVEITGRPLGEVFALLSEYFEMEIEIFPGIDLYAPIRIRFDKDVSAQEAFNVLSFATGSFDYTIKENRILIRPK